MLEWELENIVQIASKKWTIFEVYISKSRQITRMREKSCTRRDSGCYVSKTCLHTIPCKLTNYIYIEVAVLTVVVFTCGRSRKVCIVLRTDNVYCQEKWSSMRVFLAVCMMRPSAITWHRENWNCRGLGFSQFPLFNRFTGEMFCKQSWFSLE